MTSEESIEAVRGFLELLDQSPSADDSQRLELALDRLALVVASMNASFDEGDWPDPPSAGYGVRRTRAAQRFPLLGYYNIAATICGKPGESAVNVGDAIDDLADIHGHLTDTVWRWENTSPNDALWHLELSYRQHWGSHLRALQLYLHEYRHHGGGAA